MLNKRRPREEDLEEEFEKQPRHQSEWQAAARKKAKLPIVLPTGEVVVSDDEAKEVTTGTVKGKKRQQLKNDSISALESSAPISNKQRKRLAVMATEAPEKKVVVPKTTAAKKADEIRKILTSLNTREEKINEIVNSSELLVGDPEANVHRFEVLLNIAVAVPRDFQQMSRAKKTKDVSTVAFVSLGSVFENCIPGYKLRDGRELDDKKIDKALSKDVAKLQAYESTLLKYYERYVNLVKLRAKTIPHVVSAVICGLLAVGPDFNLANMLLEMCVLFACKPVTDDELGRVCSMRAVECLADLIERDATLDFAVRVARVVSKSGKFNAQVEKKEKKNKIVVNGDLLSMLSKINFVDREGAVKREASLRGIKAGEKISRDVARDLVASSIYGDHKKFMANQTEILKELFVTFLRVLRSPHVFPPDALRGSLEALGRLAFLVTDELTNDVATELRALVVERSGSLGSRDILHAVSSVVQMAKKSGTNFTVDLCWLPDAFCLSLQASLPFLLSSPNATPSIVLPPYAYFSSLTSLPQLPDLQKGDACPMLDELLDVAEHVLNSPAVIGVATSHVIVPKGLLQLTEVLFSVAANLADPICRVKVLQLDGCSRLCKFIIYKTRYHSALLDVVNTTSGSYDVATSSCLYQIIKIVDKVPSMATALDREGTILYGTGEEKTFFWTNTLMNSWGDGKTFTSNKLHQKIFDIGAQT